MLWARKRRRQDVARSYGGQAAGAASEGTAYNRSRAMASTLAPPDLQLRSNDATWNRARWERLPADGNRYEVIDGVLYMTTAPSSFHQWIVQQLHLALHGQLQTTGFGFVFISPIGLFMPGCDPVQPDVLVVRGSDRHVF